MTTWRARTLAAFALAALLACVSAVSAAHAHSGGLDKHCCHTNRKTGEYHCHRGTAPARSTLIAPAPVQGSGPSTPSRLHDPMPARTFRNCAEARAHGAAPVRRGNPGYGPHLDRDNDGVGCEPYRGR